MALIEGRPRSASVRARTEVEVTTFGAQVFSRMSKTLTPLQRRLAEAIRQRSAGVWTRMPEVHAVLSRERVSAFAEPAPFTLRADTTFEDAVALFATHHADTVYVVDADGHLSGVLTRTDLLRVVEVLTSRPVTEREGVAIQHFMTADPVAVAIDDLASVAALLMWNRGFKSLPVVSTSQGGRLIGCFRAETVMQSVMQRLLAARQLATPVASRFPGPSAVAGSRTDSHVGSGFSRTDSPVMSGFSRTM
jgi:NADH dehydrogenase